MPKKARLPELQAEFIKDADIVVSVGCEVVGGLAAAHVSGTNEGKAFVLR